MKSIREKANEYAKDYLFSSIGREPNVHFEAGANYVLKQIESLPNKTIDIYNLIEQLKK